MRSKANRTVAAVTAAALALPTAGVAPAFAASKSAKNTTVSAASDTEFSSSHRYHGHRYNNAAGAAAFAAIIGGIATYAAAREYRKARERSYYNGYYGQPYGSYGGGYYRPHYGYGW
jgi:hypothetical protein